MQLKDLGTICRNFRVKKGVSIKDIAKASNYSVWNVYKFEQGGNDNAAILLAYIYYGLKLDRGTICRVLAD